MILGESELANGQVRVKEMGLDAGHPEKDGVLVDLGALVGEVKSRLARKKGGDVEGLVRELKGTGV